MKKTLLFLLSMALLAFVWAQPGAEDRAMPGPDGERPGPGKHLQLVLDLNDDQMAKIEEFRLQQQKEAIPLRAEAEKLQAEIQLVMVADKFDQGKLENLVKASEKVHSQLRLSHLLHQQKVRSLLTDEQKTRYDNMMLARGKGQREGHGQRPRFQRAKGPRG